MSYNLYKCARLTSGDKEVISLVNGFGYSGGTTPGLFKDYDFSILNTSFTALAWHFDLHVNGSFIAGFAGPGWGTGTFNNELYVYNGGNNPQALSLGGGAPYAEAGFLMGASLKFAIHVTITGWVGVRWVGGWKGHFKNIWGTLTDVNDEVQIDLIKLVVAAIKFLKDRGVGGPLAEIVKKLKPAEANPKANWSLIDTTNDQIATVDEKATSLLPQIACRVDLSEFIPPIRSFNMALKKVGSSVGCGPTFGLGFPIRIQVEGIVMDDAVYKVTATHSANAKKYYDSSGTVIAGTPSNTFTSSFRPKTVGLRYKWSWGLDFTVGVYCSISVFWVLSVSPEFHFGLLTLLGINTTVQSNIRGDIINKNFRYDSFVTDNGLPEEVEVVFEEPDAVVT